MNYKIFILNMVFVLALTAQNIQTGTQPADTLEFGIYNRDFESPELYLTRQASYNPHIKIPENTTHEKQGTKQDVKRLQHIKI